MIERIFPATEDQLEPVQSFIDGELEQYDCPPKAQIQLAVAVEEIFINIVRYAYHPEVGLATAFSFWTTGSPSTPWKRRTPTSPSPRRSGTSAAWAS